jgi:hypothetical protein
MRAVFVGAALPPLSFGEMPEISFDQLASYVGENLSKEAQRGFELLRLSIDIENVRRYLLGEPIDSRGTLSEKELEEAILNDVFLPDYVGTFLDTYQDEADRASYFGLVLSDFYRIAQEETTGFVRDYFAFERNLRLALTVYRMRALKGNLAKELQFEDPTDPLVAELLAAKDSPTFQFPYDFSDLEPILSAAGDDPMKQYMAMAQYRFTWIEHYPTGPLFSHDSILSYAMAHLIAEDVASLDSQIGWKRMREAVA